MKVEKLVSNLHKHTIDLLREENSTEAYKNSELCLNLIDKALGKSNQPNNSVIIKELINSIKSLVYKFRNYGYYNDSNNIFYDLCEVLYKENRINCHKPYLSFNMLEIEVLELFNSIINTLSKAESIYNIENLKILELLDKFFKNIGKFQNTELFRFMSVAYGDYYYKEIYAHSRLTGNEKKILLDKFINHIFEYIYPFQIKFPSVQDKEIKIRLYSYIIISIFYMTIQNYDNETYNNLLWKYNDHIINDYNHPFYKRYTSLVINVNIVHLYYLYHKDSTFKKWLTCKKEDGNGNIHKYNLINIYKKNIRNCWYTYKDTKKILSQIELSYKDSGKIFIPIIRLRLLDFFFFSTVVNNSYYSNLSIELDAYDYHMLKRWFDDDGNLKIKITEELDKFYEFTGFEKLQKDEFKKRANELIKQFKNKENNN